MNFIAYLRVNTHLNKTNVGKLLTRVVDVNAHNLGLYGYVIKLLLNNRELDHVVVKKIKTF
jgi:hypothetical protein